MFLEEWKTAILRPLLKKCGLALIESNYRPVSNLPFISKLVEQAVMKQFNTHCDLNGTTTTHQPTYKQFHSCETALTKIVNGALWAMEHMNITIPVIMDLIVAFDAIDHKVLLEVLHRCFGIEGMALEWFCSYLSSRFFKVNIGDAYSNLKELNFSVPQGSCTGLSLFMHTLVH